MNTKEDHREEVFREKKRSHLSSARSVQKSTQALMEKPMLYILALRTSNAPKAHEITSIHLFKEDEWQIFVKNKPQSPKISTFRFVL